MFGFEEPLNTSSYVVGSGGNLIKDDDKSTSRTLRHHPSESTGSISGGVQRHEALLLTQY